jgi:flavorubredoxin
MICPSHGVIWREDPLQIVNKYREWAKNYQEDQITIVYDTMWDGTRRMAETIARGLTEKDNSVSVKLFNIARSDKNDVITEVFKSKALLVGSPTINRRILSAVGGFLEEIKGLGFKNKKAAAFGCYGWSGEGVKIITEELRECGFEIINEGLRAHWNPDSTAIEDCMSFGHEVSATFEQH